MAVTRAQFDRGMTYDEYKAQMTRNRERLDAVERDVALDDADLAAFRRLPKQLNVLAIVEDWCGDVIANLPILARVASESGKLNVRCLLRDQNPEVMDQYLNRGQFRSIPVFVFLGDDFNEIGHFTERPDSVTELRAQRRKEIFAANPEFGSPDAPVDQLPEDVRGRLNQAIQAIREETAPFANREVIKALRGIVDRVAA